MIADQAQALRQMVLQTHSPPAPQAPQAPETPAAKTRTNGPGFIDVSIANHKAGTVGPGLPAPPATPAPPAPPQSSAHSQRLAYPATQAHQPVGSTENLTPPNVAHLPRPKVRPSSPQQLTTHAPLAKTIAITSGKGGVGKTNVAINLAARLSLMGRRVVLMDADMGTANADILCNISAPRHLAHVVAGRCSMEKVMVSAPGGFRLIPGASGLATMAALGAFERMALIEHLRQLESDTDLILIDTGAGVGPNVLGFATCADQLLVVTTPDPTAIADAYAVIKTALRQREGIDVRVLVNMVRDAREGRGVFDRIDAVCRHFLKTPLRYAGHVAQDARVAQAVRKRKPFVIEFPHCDAGNCMTQLAHRLDRHAAEPHVGGLLRRMANWLGTSSSAV